MSARMRAMLAGGLGVVVALSSACTKHEAGAAVPAPAPSSSANQVPQVANPLDVTKFLKAPCSTLPEQFLERSNLPLEGEPKTKGAIAEHVGPKCYWDNSEVGFSLSVGFLVGNKRGLTDLYWGHDHGSYDGYWIPTAVQGYPAVFHGPTDDRGGGNCAIATAVSNKLTFLVNLQYLRTGGDPCEWVKGAANQVITTLKGGS